VNNNTLSRYFIFLLIIFLPLVARAEVVITPGVNTFELASNLSVLKDVSVKLDIHQIDKNPWKARFIKTAFSGTAVNLGQTNGAVWIRLELKVLSSVERQWILDIPYGNLERIDWYIPKADGTGYVPAGEIIPALKNYRYHAQPIELSPGTVTLYARIVSKDPITLPLQLQTEQAFLSQEANHLFMQALYFGALVTLLLFALLFSWSVKDATYSVFSAYLLMSGFALFVGNGLARQFLRLPTLISESTLQSLCFAMAGAFSLWLTSLFLRDANLSSWFKSSMRWLAGAYLALSVAILADYVLKLDMTFLQSLLSTLTLISSIIVVIALWFERDGNRSEIYFLTAWMVVWLGALLATLRVLHWIDSNQFTLYAVQISTGLAAILFSIALFVRVRQQYQARILSQQEALDSRTVWIELLQDSERKLESTVVERTAQLSASLEAEKRLREQYVRFGAMISHEFRNPLGVIETQTSLLQRELKAGIDHADKRIGTVRSAAQRLALLFEKWLQSDRLQNATDKLNGKNIEFEEWFEDLVNKCHAYHANHKITCKIENTIGSVFFDEHLFQIAILNLIDNACKYSPAGTNVNVRAALLANRLHITVTDQGVGIDAALHTKIFDEYYRVDPNSKVLGVGLGLPFVRKIVSLHGGEVTASHSPEGQGSRFMIVIPINTHSDQPL
jgi:signal transduction histidine kinase